MKVLSVASLTMALAWTAVAAAADDFTYSPYYPMQVGATWNYKTGDAKFSVKVTTHEKVGTTMCARLETVQDGKVVGSEDVFAKDDGVYRLALDGKVIEPAVHILKLPPKPGDAWVVDSKAEGKTGTERLQGTFKTGGEEVTVPAGQVHGRDRLLRRPRRQRGQIFVHHRLRQGRGHGQAGHRGRRAEDRDRAGEVRGGEIRRFGAGGLGGGVTGGTGGRRGRSERRRRAGQGPGPGVAE